MDWQAVQDVPYAPSKRLQDPPATLDKPWEDGWVDGLVVFPKANPYLSIKNTNNELRDPFPSPSFLYAGAILGFFKVETIIHTEGPT